MLFQSSDIEPPIAFNLPRNFETSWTCTSGSDLAGFFVLIVISSCSNAHRTECRNRVGPPRLMPGGPAFGVQPCVRPRLGPKRQDNGTGQFRLATPCAAPRRRRSGMLVQPFDDATVERQCFRLRPRQSVTGRCDSAAFVEIGPPVLGGPFILPRP